MTARLQFTVREVLDALDRAIRPLDDDASMLTTNDDILDLMVDELVPDDDPARVYRVDNWLLLLDICTPDAYELAMTVSDCHQAGHSWKGTLDQLSARYDSELVDA
jgi:hypothetical protein